MTKRTATGATARSRCPGPARVGPTQAVRAAVGLLFLLLAPHAGLSCASQPSHESRPPEELTAQELHAMGTALLEAGKFAEALDAFRRAHAAAGPEARDAIMFNVAVVAAKAGDCEASAEAVQRLRDSAAAAEWAESARQAAGSEGCALPAVPPPRAAGERPVPSKPIASPAAVSDATLPPLSCPEGTELATRPSDECKDKNACVLRIITAYRGTVRVAGEDCLVESCATAMRDGTHRRDGPERHSCRYPLGYFVDDRRFYAKPSRPAGQQRLVLDERAWREGLPHGLQRRWTPAIASHQVGSAAMLDIQTVLAEQRCSVFGREIAASRRDDEDVCAEFLEEERIAVLGRAACGTVPGATWSRGATTVKSSGTIQTRCHTSDGELWHVQVSRDGEIVRWSESGLKEAEERRAMEAWATYLEERRAKEASDQARAAKILDGWRAKTSSVAARCDRYHVRLRALKVALHEALHVDDGKATAEIGALQAYLTGKGRTLISEALADGRDLLWASGVAASWSERAGDRRWIWSQIDTHCDGHGR